MNKKKYFPLMKNNFLKSDLQKVINHLKSKDPILTNGSNVELFERNWSKWLGVKYSVFVNSGSSANLISMTILKNKYPKGGEIIVPPLTWVSDIASVIQCGFTPKFVDIDMKNLAMNTDLIINSISKKTVAVFFSHIQGFNGLNKKLLSHLKNKQIPLIEDVCESHGANLNKKKCGSFGIMSNFSFYYAHHISTIEGGMVCTNNKSIYLQARMIRAHGLLRESKDKNFIKINKNKYSKLNPDFIFLYAGYNMRNNEIGGILGNSQLQRLDRIVLKRNKNHEYFLNNIDKTRFKVDFDIKGASNYAFNLILNEKNNILLDKIKKELKKNNIEYRQGSAGGGNQIMQPYIKGIYLNYNKEDFPIIEHVHKYSFYIGNYPSLTKKDIGFICKVINEA